MLVAVLRWSVYTLPPAMTCEHCCVNVTGVHRLVGAFANLCTFCSRNWLTGFRNTHHRWIFTLENSAVCGWDFKSHPPDWLCNPLWIFHVQICTGYRQLIHQVYIGCVVTRYMVRDCFFCSEIHAHFWLVEWYRRFSNVTLLHNMQLVIACENYIHVCSQFGLQSNVKSRANYMTGTTSVQLLLCPMEKITCGH